MLAERYRKGKRPLFIPLLALVLDGTVLGVGAGLADLAGVPERVPQLAEEDEDRARNG